MPLQKERFHGVLMLERFCRATLAVLSQNPQIVPLNLALPGGVADLTALDLLRPH